MKNFILSLLLKLLPTKLAYAHCDVPCGIYDPRPAQIAAQTILRMVQLLEGLPKEKQKANDTGKFVRYVLTKEEHAGKCKEELLILWTDYFRQEHLVAFPHLHEIFWKAAKLCSKNKQEINMKAAQELIKIVNEISDVFRKTKNTASKK